jgi:hypothetical protein
VFVKTGGVLPLNVTAVRFVQFANTSLPIVLTCAGIVISVSRVFLNAAFPMLVTLGGITTEVMLSPSNAETPMLVMLSGSVIEVIAVLRKTLSPMLVILLPRLTVARLVEFMNTAFPK